MKAEITYNQIENIICVKITNPNRTIFDVEETGSAAAKLQRKHHTLKVFYDHSYFSWKFDYLQEYSIAKNLDKLLPFLPDTKVAFYLGDYYNEKYWKLMEEIIANNSKVNLKYFGKIEDSKSWLASD